MGINLPPEIESIAINAARQRGYSDVAEFIAEAVRAASRDSESERPSAPTEQPATGLSYSQWRERFDAFLASRRQANPNFDDSRESIYLDRP